MLEQGMQTWKGLTANPCQEQGYPLARRVNSKQWLHPHHVPIHISIAKWLLA